MNRPTMKFLSSKLLPKLPQIKLLKLTTLTLLVTSFNLGLINTVYADSTKPSTTVQKASTNDKKQLNSAVIPAIPSTLNSTTQASQAMNAFKQMYKSVRDLNYTMYFVNQKNNVLSSYMFSNFYDKKLDKRYSILRNLEGPFFEVVLKNGIVSYPKFSLENSFISDELPAIFNGNINEIKDYYSFTYNGEARVANREGTVYDVSNKYSNLFSYQVTLDKQTDLPLKIVLVEKDLINNTFLILDTWTVNYLNITPSKSTYDYILNHELNKNLLFKKQIDPSILNKVNSILHIPYLPAGFKLQSTQIVTLNGNNIVNNGDSSDKNAVKYYAETYSDGLFSFNLYVSVDPNTAKDHSYFRNGEISLYTENYANRKLIVVGQIPLLLAKGIINSVQIYKAPNEFYDDKHPEGYGQQITVE